jgi:hypothetical protein
MRYLDRVVHVFYKIANVEFSIEIFFFVVGFYKFSILY